MTNQTESQAVQTHTDDSPDTSPTIANDTLLFDISATAARFAATCMGTVDIRHYLNGIHVEPSPNGGVFVVGTDGHTLAACEDSTGILAERDEQGLPRSVLLSLTTEFRKLLPKKSSDDAGWRLKLFKCGTRLILELTDQQGRIKASTLTAEGEGKYPDWRRLIPDLQKCERIAPGAMNAAYMGRVSSCIDTKKMYPPVMLHQQEPYTVIAVNFIDFPECLMLIMPIFSNGTEQKASTWASTWSAHRTQAKPEESSEPADGDEMTTTPAATSAEVA